jgi:hypothetical protein
MKFTFRRPAAESQSWRKNLQSTICGETIPPTAPLSLIKLPDKPTQGLDINVL